MIDIRYNIRPYLKDNGSVLLRVRWDKQTKNVVFSTGLFAEAAKWDSIAFRAKSGTRHRVGIHDSSAGAINDKITSISIAVEQSFREFGIRDIVPSGEELKKSVKKKIAPSKLATTKSAKNRSGEMKYDSLRSLLDDYFAVNVHKWEERSKIKYSQAVTHAYKYQPKIKLSELDQRFMVGLVQWHIDNGYSNCTTNSKISALKTLFRWGLKNGYSVNSDVFNADTAIREHKKRVIFLHYDELIKMLSYEFLEKDAALKKYRDMFAFMCFTGLRYCDMITLKKSDLLESGYISIYTEKTEEFIKIPLVTKAKEILSQYTSGSSEYVFPKVSNQKVNDNIKVVAEMVGLDREVVETKYVGKRKVEEHHP